MNIGIESIVGKLKAVIIGRSVKVRIDRPQEFREYYSDNFTEYPGQEICINSLPNFKLEHINMRIVEI